MHQEQNGMNLINTSESIAQKDVDNMLGWIYSFLIGSFCSHKWVILEIQEKTKPVYDTNRNEIRHRCIGKTFVLRCEKCGNLKFVENSI